MGGQQQSGKQCLIFAYSYKFLNAIKLVKTYFMFYISSFVRFTRFLKEIAQNVNSYFAIFLAVFHFQGNCNCITFVQFFPRMCPYHTNSGCKT